MTRTRSARQAGATAWPSSLIGGEHPVAEPAAPAPPLVLVVEDRPSIRQLLKIALSREGFRVEDAATAGEGLARMRSEPPDVVLLDLLLPGARGEGFIAEMRRQPQVRHVPVIVLSGMEDGLAASVAAGAQDFLAKPFDLDELTRRVRLQLRRATGHGTPA